MNDSSSAVDVPNQMSLRSRYQGDLEYGKSLNGTCQGVPRWLPLVLIPATPSTKPGVSHGTRVTKEREDLRSSGRWWEHGPTYLALYLSFVPRTMEGEVATSISTSTSSRSRFCPHDVERLIPLHKARFPRITLPIFAAHYRSHLVLVSR